MALLRVSVGDGELVICLVCVAKATNTKVEESNSA